MREGSGGGSGDGVCEARGAAFGNYDAMRAGRQSCTDDGAEVVGVFNAIEENDEADLTFGLVGASENVFESCGGSGSGHGDYALMLAGAGEAIQLAAIFEADGDAALAGKLDDLFNAGILAALGDEDAVEGGAGFESFADGVNASETIHGEAVYS
jgi:hypothetical protein